MPEFFLRCFSVVQLHKSIYETWSNNDETIDNVCNAIFCCAPVTLTRLWQMCVSRYPSCAVRFVLRAINVHVSVIFSGQLLHQKRALLILKDERAGFVKMKRDHSIFGQ